MGTLVRFLVTVGVEVLCQGIAHSTPEITLTALIGFLSSVTSLVSSQSTGIIASVVTFGAVKRLFTSVNPSVAFQLCLVSKRFAAKIANIRFLSSVCARMNLQMLFQGELFFTNITHKRLFSRVRSHVHGEARCA